MSSTLKRTIQCQCDHTLKKRCCERNIMVKNPSRQTSWIFVSVAEELNSEPPRAPSASGGTVLINMTTGLKVDCAYLFISKSINL